MKIFLFVFPMAVLLAPLSYATNHTGERPSSPNRSMGFSATPHAGQGIEEHGERTADAAEDSAVSMEDQVFIGEKG